MSSAMDSPRVIALGRNDFVEVTVKRKNKTEMQAKKGEKHMSSTANSISGQKIEKKRSTISNNKNWCNTFAEQNALYFKQMQSSKHCKTEDAKRNLNAKNQQKNSDNHTNANSSKRTSQKKSEDRSKSLCCSAVLVQDCAIQHPEICDNGKFAEFNPIHTLGSLMKDLKDLIRKDKKACEISNKIEQLLSKISINPENLLSEDLKIKLKDTKTQMEDSGEKIKTLLESQKLEREQLRSQIRKQENYIKEIKPKLANLEIHVKMLKEQLEKVNRQLEEVTCTAETKDKTISILKQQIENSELSERVISDLKAELVKQTELARKNHINNQYLTLERDKCSQLCNYKDTLIKNYENTVKKLQAQIPKQFEVMNEVHVKIRSGSAHTSTIHTGLTCSSPTSSFSNRSTESLLNDLSDLSSVRHETQEYVTTKENATVKDSAHLELVSLLDGESSHTILDSYQNQVTNDKGVTAQNNNSANRNLNTNNVTGRSLYHSLENDYNKENNVYKMKKFSRPEEIQNNAKKNSFYHDASKILESIASNKIPVNVPSPVRDYPCSDWSDTSLPSISTASNLNMVSSIKND